MSGWGSLHGLDYLFLGLVAAGAIRGIVRGLSRELLVLAAMGVIVWASGRWYGEASAVIQRGGQLSPESCDLVAFGLLVVGLFLAFLLLRLLLKPFVKFSFSGPVERLGGGAIGAIEAAFAGAAAMIALSLIPDEGLHRTVTQDSAIGSRLTAAFPTVYDRVAERYHLPGMEALRPPEPAGGATGDGTTGSGQEKSTGGKPGKKASAHRDRNPGGGEAAEPEKPGSGDPPAPQP